MQRYVFPVQFLLGITGNCLNLVLLLSRSMRSKTNFILASTALADVGFLIARLPACLAAFQPFADNLLFHQLYQTNKMHLVAIANWTSAASIWLVLTVTIERLLAIKFPLQAKFYLDKRKLTVIVSTIVILSFALTFYYNLHYHISRVSFCSGTQVYYNFISVTKLPKTSSSLKTYIRCSTILNLALVVAGPLVALVTLNVCLILVLKRQHRAMLVSSGSGNQRSEGMRTNPEQAKSSERKVTAMVVAIVTTFTITNVPSGAIYIWHYLHHFEVMSALFYDIASASNSLVVTGKVLNFFLYCTSSANFRRNLLTLMARKNSKLAAFLSTFVDISSYTNISRSQPTANSCARSQSRASSLISAESMPLRSRASSATPWPNTNQSPAAPTNYLQVPAGSLSAQRLIAEENSPPSHRNRRIRGSFDSFFQKTTNV